MALPPRRRRRHRLGSEPKLDLPHGGIPQRHLQARASRLPLERDLASRFLTPRALVDEMGRDHIPTAIPIAL